MRGKNTCCQRTTLGRSWKKNSKPGNWSRSQPYSHSFKIITRKDFSITKTSCCCCCQVASVASNSVQPHRRQPTRLPRPWDSAGKNTGVGCHCLLHTKTSEIRIKTTMKVSPPSDQNGHWQKVCKQ